MENSRGERNHKKKEQGVHLSFTKSSYLGKTPRMKLKALSFTLSVWSQSAFKV